MASGLTGIGIVVAVAAGVMFARSAVNARMRRRARARYNSVCSALGLTLECTDAPFPRAHGTRQTHTIELWVDELRTFGLDRQFVRIRVGVADVPELFIRTRRIEIEQSTWREVLTGDLAFDDTVRVSTPKPATARAWLNSERRLALLILSKTVVNWSIGDGVIGVSSEGLSADTRTWQAQLDALTDAASALETT
jgi:hypothetical protein